MTLIEAVLEATRRMGRDLSLREKTQVFEAWLQSADGQLAALWWRKTGTDPQAKGRELLESVKKL